MNDQNIHLLYTAITRFGTVLFIIYTVSVLLNVFRYIMRLAAYHEARADAIILAMETGTLHAENFAEFVSSLNAEKIEFGKEPTTPLENAVELIKAVGEAAKKTKE
jgi:hypothetical protein